MGKDTVRELIGKFDSKNECEVRKTAQEMDEMRQRTLAYEYLCHLEEAKVWLEACLHESLPPTTELEENLRNGVYLAKLGHFIAPNVLPKNKIYDIEQKRYRTAGLQFRHTDNINLWLRVIETTELPQTFQPETTDIYDKKNMPRAIYCIHALSTHLFKLGRAPLIQDLYGKVTFTEEEIDAVSIELQKYGITMPAFQKIGGLLSSNLDGDTAGLHAAVIRLNKALDDGPSLSPALLNPEVRLKYVCKELVQNYTNVLKNAKSIKVRNALNRSLNDSYVPDIYDELLTQMEIQGHITLLNFQHSWNKLTAAAKNNDTDALSSIFKAEWIKTKNEFDTLNQDFYCDIIRHLDENSDKMASDTVVDWQKIFDGIIGEGNKRAFEHDQHKRAIRAVNQSLDRGGPDELYEALTNPYLEINIKDETLRYAAPLFYEEMKLDKEECEKELNQSEIASSLLVLSGVASVSSALSRGDEAGAWAALQGEVRTEGLRAHCRHRYTAALTQALKAKASVPGVCPLLTYFDIQDCIDTLNAQDDNSEQLIEILNQINKAVTEEDSNSLVTLLRNPKLNLNSKMHNEEAHLCLRLMKLSLKRERAALWLQDVEDIVAQVSLEAKEVEAVTETLVNINIAMSKMNCDNLVTALLRSDIISVSIDHDKHKLCFKAFTEYYKRKNRYVCPWVVFHTSRGNTVYIDIESSTHSWVTPKDFVPHSRYMSMKDVDSVLRKIKRHNSSRLKKESVEKIIVGLQACARGYLVRQSRSARHKHFYTNLNAIVKIQSWWRSLLIQKKYKSLIKMKILENGVRELREKDPWSWYKVQEKKIIKIQALWRGRSTRMAFLSLIRNRNPTFKVVRRFVPLLEFSTEDYEKEMELQTMKSNVVRAIRKNQELSKHLDEMDIKIGLLVQNRISLQDVMAHGVKINNLVKHNSTSKLTLNRAGDNEENKVQNRMMSVSTSVKGLKSLTAESKKLLDGYQHLFYELQVNPYYLSKLLLCVPQNKTNQFLQNVIMTLYNFGANSRDEYLLLKLFRRTLEEEIKSKISKPSDVITSNPIVLKMAVNHSRQMTGLASLRAIIGPLVEKMLNDKDISIETGPVEIFKAWRNEMEMRTGQISTLPFSVSQEQALAYPEVRVRLERGLATLRDIVGVFVDKITCALSKMPFSILYMARVLHRALSSKYPMAQEKEILKIVGNLVYYQFLNAAIVAPDAFHVIDLPPDRALTTDQRRNLASVAKILHFAAAKKGFGEESPHLKCMNAFIVECHDKMKAFFKECCHGPSLEQYYQIDEYTEVTLLHRPHIYISIQEIVDTHSLLVEYEDSIAPEPHWRLHDLLEALGPVPAAADLASRDENARLDVCLALVNKFEAVDEDKLQVNKLFIKTKELCVSVMPFLQGEHLLEALCFGTTQEQQEQYAAWVQRRMYSGALRSDEVTTLREHITLLRSHLAQLEEQGYVDRADAYQAIITSIALDLCNKGKYRVAQRAALASLRSACRALQDKTKFYEEQSSYYDRYLTTCLHNLNTGKRSVHARQGRGQGQGGKLKAKYCLKYSGQQLLERGVLVEIAGLQPAQYKQVQFCVRPAEQAGEFGVSARLLGVQLDEVHVQLQDLLQRQYRGDALMDIFGKATVNVNLLLFLLNTKFYGKK